ncbi:CAP domain-containing protein [Alkalicoccobacillus gibsonii]|uniref:CAP domain-containing protein n=1 Tax=Alkalicoccobacillus gibsonii TaxID=79881 RepID=UPI001931A2B3|nr:CAP domain-containing protein [Alkalicoccobacillus gibsonii]MBM0067449.1 CAP domain-containing protein [Alkalicoccobacillus gibsonii]
MRRFILLIAVVVIVFTTRHIWMEPAKELLPASIIDPIQRDMDSSVDHLSDLVQSILPNQNSLSQTEDKEIERPAPELGTPDQLFSVHNTELGDSRTDVENELGEPMRTSRNEYGLDWVAYHDDYHEFVMVAYDAQDSVKGLYTNQDLISSTTPIEYGTSKDVVREQLGEPEAYMRKGLYRYEVNQDQEYDLFQLDDSYVTVFYDKHQDNMVTAIQLIDSNLEQSKKELYTQASNELKEGFEYQLFDLTNASRVNHGLGVLTWDEQVRETARNHSLDMAENQYFSHTNLQGQSPFDRMEQDDISFKTAGENLAYGQMSSIFAHEGLMNSQGHRENILQDRFLRLGVGVAFNEQSQPYYTENFFTS